MTEPSELELRARELDLAAARARAERWRNPLTVAVIAAALAGFSNAYIAYANNQAQVALETSKAESARILEVLKIGEPRRVRENLHFLVQLGLVESEPLRGRLEAWDANPRRAPVYLSPTGSPLGTGAGGGAPLGTGGGGSAEQRPAVETDRGGSGY